MTEYFTLSIFNKYLMENVTSVPIYDISSKTVVLLDSCKGNKELVFLRAEAKRPQPRSLDT